MVYKLSKLFRPASVLPKDAIVKSKDITSRSQRLLLELGLIKSGGNGLYHILPIAQRAIDKIVDLVELYMKRTSSQKITLPILSSSALWKKSGRFGAIEELFHVKDKHGKEYVLGPTHEESIAELMATSSISYKNLPLRLYQVGSKFRDELKPRCGLIRTKEFIMKDLYTFDKNYEDAEKTYQEIGAAYSELFNALQIPWIKVKGNSGIMGGHVSHEYHILLDIGEDRIVYCDNCGFSCNEELHLNGTSCLKCGHNITTKKGVEIAHTFILNDKYTKPLDATFLQGNGKPEYLIMGCFGIGITRLLAASLEVLSTEENLKWPILLSPFDVCIIPPKKGSKEENEGSKWISKMWNGIENILGSDAILLDDRTNFTIGKRLLDSKKMGYPLIVVVGNKVLDKSNSKEPTFELHDNNSNEARDLRLSELLSAIAEYKNTKSDLEIENSFYAQQQRIA